MADTTCGIIDLYCIQQSSLISEPWKKVYMAYREEFAKIIESCKLHMIIHRVEE